MDSSDHPTRSTTAKPSAPLLAARPRLDTRRHSDSMVPSVATGSSPATYHHSIAGGTTRRDQPTRFPTDGVHENDHPAPLGPSPPCPTPLTNEPTDPLPLTSRTHPFYTRVPTNPSDLRTIQWQLTPDQLKCLSSTGGIVAEFELDELVWRADGMYGIEFGLDSRFVAAGEKDGAGPEMQVVEATIGSLSSLSASATPSQGTVVSEAEQAGPTSLSQELLAALQREAERQKMQLTHESTDTVIVQVSNASGSELVLESMDSFLNERVQPGVTSRPGTAVDAGCATRPVGAMAAATDSEQEQAESMGYVEGFRIYSENAMEVTDWLNMLNTFRGSHPLIPRITSSERTTEHQLIDSCESIAPPANTRRNSAAIGNPEALMATVASQLQNNATPAAIRVTIVPPDHPLAVGNLSLTPPGSVGSSASLSGGGGGEGSGTSTTTAKFIRILDAIAHGGPVVVSTSAGSRVTVKNQATRKTALDVRDSLEILHEKMSGDASGAESPQSSLGSLQSVERTSKIPLAGGVKPTAHAGYKMPLKGESDSVGAAALPLPKTAGQQEPTSSDAGVDGDNTLGNAQWRILKNAGVSAPVTVIQEQAPPKLVIGNPEPTNGKADGEDEQEVLGDTLKGSGSAMRLKGAVVATLEQAGQDSVGLSRMGM